MKDYTARTTMIEQYGLDWYRGYDDSLMVTAEVEYINGSVELEDFNVTDWTYAELRQWLRG